MPNYTENGDKKVNPKSNKKVQYFFRFGGWVEKTGIRPINKL